MNPALEIRNLSRFYGTIPALNNFSLNFGKGEVVGIAGSNGSGKTTLLNILSGDAGGKKTSGISGEILFNSKPYFPADTSYALSSGVGLVHQEASLIPPFTIAENIALGREKTYSVTENIFGKELALIDEKSDISDAQTLINEFRLNISPSIRSGSLSISTRQFIEIMRVISRPELKLLLLDEPTSAMNDYDALILIDKIRELSALGVTVIFVSHRLDELISVCDRIAVLRNGELQRVFKRSEFSKPGLIFAMTGKIHSLPVKNVKNNFKEPVLKFSNFSVSMPGEELNKIDLEIMDGEIFGLTGYSGHGRLAPGNGLAGLYPSSGEIFFKGKKIIPGKIDRIIKEGLLFLSEERLANALLLENSIRDNMLFTAIQVNKKYCGRFGFPLRKKCGNTADEYIEKLEIKCESHSQPVNQLSGGNQQKVCIARMMIMEPELLFIAEPTRGIDVGTKSVILELLQKINSVEKTTVVISSGELDELRQICSRIAVFYDGEIFKVLNADASEKEFAYALAGENL